MRKHLWEDVTSQGKLQHIARGQENGTFYQQSRQSKRGRPPWSTIFTMTIWNRSSPLPVGDSFWTGWHSEIHRHEGSAHHSAPFPFAEGRVHLRRHLCPPALRRKKAIPGIRKASEWSKAWQDLRICYNENRKGAATSGQPLRSISCEMTARARGGHFLLQIWIIRPAKPISTKQSWNSSEYVTIGITSLPGSADRLPFVQRLSTG